MRDDDVLLRRAVDELDDVVYVYDESGRLVYWNDRLNGLFDLTDDELRGMASRDFLLEPDRDGVERASERSNCAHRTSASASSRGCSPTTSATRCRSRTPDSTSPRAVATPNT